MLTKGDEGSILEVCVEVPVNTSAQVLLPRSQAEMKIQPVHEIKGKRACRAEIGYTHIACLVYVNGQKQNVQPNAAFSCDIVSSRDYRDYEGSKRLLNE